MSGAHRKTRNRILAVVVATLASLFVAEILFRWFGPTDYAPGTILTWDGREVPLSELAHYLRHSDEGNRRQSGPRGRIQANLHFKHRYDRPIWDYFDAQGCISIDTNSLGFRDLEFPVEKPEGSFRILALGDSFTYGSGVQLEDTWPQVLEQELSDRQPGTVEVINGGFAAGSHWPPGYVDWLRSDGLAFQPDLVILGLCLNDMGDVPLLAYPKAEPVPWLGGVSQLLNYVQQGLVQHRLMAERRDHGDVVRKDPQMWEATQLALTQMRDLLEAQDTGFAVVVLPMISQLGEHYPYLSLHDMAAQFLETNDVAYVDLLDPFRGREEADLWAHPTDQHPNDVGHRLIAVGIRQFLEQNEMLR